MSQNYNKRSPDPQPPVVQRPTEFQILLMLEARRAVLAYKARKA